MEKEYFNKNTNESGSQDGFEPNQNEENDLVTETDLTETQQYCDKDSTLDSANDIVISDQKVEVGDSLGKFTDSTIVDGVAAQGIFGSELKIEISASEQEQQELMVQGIDALYDNENNAYEVTANEFEQMTNVIDGVERKPRKKKKKKTKVRKIVIKTYATVICAVLCIVVIYFGVTLFKTAPTQGMSGADLIVDMTDLPHYVGTNGEIDFNKMFPDGSEFKRNGTAISNGILKINSTDGFELTYTQTIEDKSIDVTRQVQVVDGAINVSDWDSLKKSIDKEEIICIQSANIAVPEMAGKKEKEMPTLNLKNDLYGNGCKLNVFEIVCCRAKLKGKLLNEPYLQGNGKEGGYTAFKISPKEDGSQVLMQDLHIIGNDMSTAEGGNLAGVSDVIIEKRGLKLFSGYGYLIGLTGDTEVKDGEIGPKANFKLKHCVLENGHQIIHVRHSNVEMEGNIIRNASDTTLSVATYANEKSVITSKNNVLANALTGGVVFYCFDSNISENNAENSWNVLDIVEGSFLDIYNWKLQDGLAFMPETEEFAAIANPVAAKEIPLGKYDQLKSIIDGQKYIHFAIVKLRTGGGLSKNGSYVNNYQSIGYQTTADKGYEKGFPLPDVAASIIKDIDVWGYYERGDLDVTPTAVLDQETVSKLYKELKTERVK